jgi:hypothetical protein
MKKKFLALITVAIISTPTLFAFHGSNTDQLADGMPVVFMITGYKFTPQQHSEARAALQTMYASECYLSQRFNVDMLVDAAENGTMMLRWPNKESFMADQKTITDPSQPQGICESIANMRTKMGRMLVANGGDPGSDLKGSLATSIAPSPR